MRIDTVHIDRFGALEDAEIGPFQKGVNIVEGPNEAGKSTLLAFLRYTLFGYPTPSKNPFKSRGKGKYGGRIRAFTGDGRTLNFERHDGPKGGPASLIRSDGSRSEEEKEWKEALGHADKDLFQNVYAFSIDELSDPGLLKDRTLLERVLSAGYGSGAVSPGEVRKRLKERSDAIYAKGKRTARFNELKRELDEVRQRIEERKTHQKEYERVREELRQLEAEKEERTKERKGLERELEKVQRTLDLVPAFNRYQEAEELLQRIGEPPEVGAEDGKAFERLLEEIEEKSSGSKELKSTIEELSKNIDRVEVDRELLEQKDRIRKLGEQRELFVSDLDTKEEATRKKEALERSFQQKSSDLGIEESEEWIRSFEGVETEKQAIKAYQEAFERIREKEREFDAQLRNRPSANGDPGRPFLAAAAAAFLFALAAFLGQYFLIGSVLFLGGVGFFIYGLNSRKAHKQKEDPLERERTRIAKEREELEGQWKRKLQDLGVSEELAPDGVLEYLSGIAELRRLLQQKEEEEERVRALQDRMKRVREKLEPFFEGKLDDDREIPDRIRQLQESLEKAEEADRKKKDLEGRKAEYEKSYEQRKKEKDSLEEKKKELLEKAGVNSEEAFREKVELQEQRKEAENKRKEALQRIEDTVGKERAPESIAHLKKVRKEELEEQKRELEANLEEAREKEQEKAQRKGHLEKQEEDLRSKSDLASLRNEEEALWNRMRQAYLEWLSERTALRVLDQVRERYEREQQPALIQEASRHFERFTQGRYPQIRLPLESDEDRSVRVFARNEAATELSSLSRGTREQLLLAVRLGFIAEYEKEHEPLPIAIDEVLVNFDEERASATAKALSEFASERQLILFTCHPWTKDLFGGEQVNRVEIQRVKGEGV